MTKRPPTRPRVGRAAAAGALAALLASTLLAACRPAAGVEEISSAPVGAAGAAGQDVSGQDVPGSGPVADGSTTEVPTTTVVPTTVPLPDVALDVAGDPGGFAGTIGLTGGYGHDVHLVTSTDDRGPGTYRDALSGGERIIRFDPALDGATIVLDDPIVADGSDITVDGSGVDITISGRATKFTGTNVIVAGMHYRDLDGSDDEDALTFLDASETQVVGLFGNIFSHATDGLVDLIWNRGNDVYATVCGNVFEHHDKAMLIDSGRSGREGGTYHVTLCHNLWRDVYQRTPLSRSALVHQYNSVFEQYGKPNGDGGGSKAGGDDDADAQHLLENNVAVPRALGEVTFDGSEVTNPRAEWAGPQLHGEGHLRITGTLLLRTGDVTAIELEQDRDRVFTPPYAYDLVPATPELRTVITETAGRCVPVGADRPIPCAPTLLAERGERIGVDLSGDGAALAAVVGLDVVVDGVVAGSAEQQGDGRWVFAVDGDPGTTSTAYVVARLADGRTAASDVVVVGFVG
jgi:pectate lyase